jgi:hypothetical protein
VGHEQPLKFGRDFQHFHITFPRQLRFMRSLEINKGFSAQDAIDDSAVKVYIRPET